MIDNNEANEFKTVRPLNNAVCRRIGWLALYVVGEVIDKLKEAGHVGQVKMNK